MTYADRQASEFIMDLALDTIPDGAEMRAGGQPDIETLGAPDRLSLRMRQRETAGWELMRDPVYEK